MRSRSTGSELASTSLQFVRGEGSSVNHGMTRHLSGHHPVPLPVTPCSFGIYCISGTRWLGRVVDHRHFGSEEDTSRD